MIAATFPVIHKRFKVNNTPLKKIKNVIKIFYDILISDFRKHFPRLTEPMTLTH